MLELHKCTPATPQEQERLVREIAACTSFTGATDREIFKRVYELAAKEIKIVERDNSRMYETIIQRLI